MRTIEAINYSFATSNEFNRTLPSVLISTTDNDLGNCYHPPLSTVLRGFVAPYRSHSNQSQRFEIVDADQLLWDSLGITEILWDSLRFFKILWDSFWVYGIVGSDLWNHGAAQIVQCVLSYHLTWRMVLLKFAGTVTHWSCARSVATCAELHNWSSKWHKQRKHVRTITWLKWYIDIRMRHAIVESIQPNWFDACDEILGDSLRCFESDFSFSKLNVITLSVERIFGKLTGD